jgi:hypothetical protein
MAVKKPASRRTGAEHGLLAEAMLEGEQFLRVTGW